VAPSSAGFSSLTRRQRTQVGPKSGEPILRLAITLGTFTQLDDGVLTGTFKTLNVVVRRDRPRDVSGSETATAPPSPRAAAGAQRRTREARKFGSAAAARRPALLPAGEILPTDRLAAAPAGSRP
jgi:hypothetical protein